MKVVGLKIRTKNARAVMDLPALWGKFCKLKDRIPGAGETIVVYSNYEFDHQGEFDYLIGKQVEEGALEEGEFDFVEIPTEGNFWTQKVEGIMPMALVSAWQKIWQLGLKRRYDCDYEVHKADGSVEIYVGLNE